MSENKEIIRNVELCIENDEVVKRYKVTDAIEIVRCKTSIFFHSTGFFAVSKPTLANNLKGGALFEMLQWYCDYKDSRDEYTPEEQVRYDTVCDMIVVILTLPLDVFTDIDFMLDIADSILQKRNEYYGRLVTEAATPREETLEDVLENVAFEGEVRASEEALREIREIAKKRDGTDVTAS